MNRKPKIKHWIFRIQSNRGTDIVRCVALRQDMARKEVKEVAEDWARDETAGTSCHEYTVTWHPVDVPSRRTLMKMWKSACTAKHIADERYNELREMLTPRNLSTAY